MNFYQALRGVIQKEIIPKHDGLIEGGIGNNFARYKYVQGLGYDKLYIGIDLEKPNIPLAEGLIHRMGDCFNAELLRFIFNEYQIKNPAFLTNGALSDSLLSDEVNQIERAVKTLTDLFELQVHIRPAGNFPITPSRVNFLEQTDNKGYHKFMRFLEESRKRGWKEKVWRDIILLKKEV